MLLLDKSFEGKDLKVNKSSKDSHELKIIIVFFFSIFLILILVSRLYYLQIYKYNDYKKKSEDNRLRIIPVPAKRGLILDKNGNVLVNNKTTYSLFIYPTKLTNDVKSKINNLSKVIKIDKDIILDKIKQVGYNSPYPILIKSNIDNKLISIILENRFNFPPLTIEPSTIRNHPYNNLASHILGYTGEINNYELEEKKDKNYKIGDVIGKYGVEQLYEDFLRGKEGGQYIEVDSIGRKIRLLNYISSVQGKNIYLTIDLNLQKKVESLIEGKKAAVVVMDVNNGNILAMASKPDYNPNLFYSNFTEKEWKKIQKLDNPFLNRAINRYTPGSIFKIITTAAALDLGLLSEHRQFYSKGYFMLGGYRFSDWNPHGFGWVNIDKALAYSIDTVYYELSLELGINNIKKYSNLFGLGNKTNIGLLGEQKGIIPDNEWKIKNYKIPWYPGDSVNASIGQGFVMLTPIQATVMIAAVANGGKVLKPKLLNRVDGQMPPKVEIVRKVNISEKNMNIIRKGLRSAVVYGTASALRFNNLSVAGKTGSAEDPPNKKTHAWIVSYAPYENPKYAVTVFIQNGGHGGDVAAPIAREIYKYLFKVD